MAINYHFVLHVLDSAYSIVVFLKTPKIYLEMSCFYKIDSLVSVRVYLKQTILCFCHNIIFCLFLCLSPVGILSQVCLKNTLKTPLSIVFYQNIFGTNVSVPATAIILLLLRTRPLKVHGLLSVCRSVKSYTLLLDSS